MKFTFFKSSIEEGNCSSVYILEGEDAFFREKALKILANKFVSSPSLNLSEFNGENFDEGEILSSLCSFPFMSDKRVTVIKEFYPKASLIKKIEECLNDNSTTILVISNSKKSEGLKKIKDCVFVDCNKGETNELARWIKAYFNQNKIETDLQTSIQIAEFCLRDMSRIELECEKLIAYANDKGYVDSSDVELLVNRDNEYKIYNMTDCIAKKQFDKAMSIVNEMLSKGESYQMIIVAVYNYFRKLLHIRISNKSDEETAKLLGMQEFAYKKTKAQALKFGAKSLKKAIDQLCDTDYKIKSGMLDAESGSLNTIFSIMISK